ncbi:MAG: hypothetical protein M1410_03250 [Candidatus Thermoplasmatota archaeon]|jgi:hypothetical protein|nr:hypothetical protein [Candidatus Thermoplasmatota archaeon]
MRIAVGQRLDLEVDREDLENMAGNSIIATWYHLGEPIYIELQVNQSMLAAIRGAFHNEHQSSALFSLARVSAKKYVVEPTVVLLKKRVQTQRERR